ncbi:unnamed protein product [Pieris brassicae]|uniref:Uncharacterized protein n=1 Tax=Pieris brassicae TaxID=7116 RepID=A0A9P0TS57_PIEBR|nr:unnamed protein product [Pieris brassicae]
MSAILKFIRENHILAVIEQAIAKKKSRLSLNSFEITEIPTLLYSCIELEHLYLHLNNITTVPVQITELLNLTTLTLDYNGITSLPVEIGLREIPKEIGKLTKLDTFGARGNELKTIPEEMTQLTKLRWLTLENNQIEVLPNCMNNMEGIVHCNLRKNRLKEFPESFLKCVDLMFLQLNNNQISSLPDNFDTSQVTVLEMIDLRENPICELSHLDHPLVRFSDEIPVPQDLSPSSSRPHGMAAQALAVNATALRLPAVPAPRHPDLILEMEMDASSVESEDWENSVNSSELDVHYQSDEERGDNEAVGMVLPELSRYASTAS